MMNTLHTASCMALALLCSACGTVTSKRATESDQPPGLVYYLPMRMLKVTVTPTSVNSALLKTARDAARTELDAARNKHLDAVEAEEVAAQKLKSANLSQRVKLTESYVRARTETTDAKSEYEQLSGVLARASERLASARANDCTYSAKIEAMSAIADPAYRYVARLSHNGTRDDDLNLAVSAEGLLTTSGLKSVDRTGDILVELGGLLSPLNDFDMEDRSSPTDQGISNCGSERVFIFDPAPNDSTKNPRVLPGFAYANQQLASYGIELSHGNLPSVPSDVSPAPTWGAIYYRAPMPVIVTIKQESGLLTSSVVNIPQIGPTAYLPMKASAFVTTEDKVTIVDGSVSSWTTSRPSEVLAIVKVPLAIIKSAIAVPTEIFRLRVDYDSKAKAARQSELERMKDEAKRREIRACIAAAEENKGNISDCFKD